ncbi:MAG: hypothetical protein ACNA7V_07105 [Bacteroidales bacterium]
MKKLSYLLGLMVVAGFIFSACSKDDDEPDPPAVNFLGGIYTPWGVERVSSDQTLAVGEGFVFGFTATSKSDKNLSRILVKRNYENVSNITMLDSTVSVKSFTIDIETIAYPNTPGVEVFEVTVTDANNKSASISFTITTTPGDPGIHVYTDIQLGSYSSPTNSSFASASGETFSLSQANSSPEIQNKIDWVYFHGATYGHTLMSPSNNVVYDLYPSIATWTNKRTTKFAKTTLTASQYNDVASKNQLVLTIQNQGIQLTENFYSQMTSNPGGFSVNDVIAFEATGGKYGLLLVTEVNAGANNGLSTIKYNIKVVK